MLDNKIKAIADNANFIVCGYAFTLKENDMIDIMNLEHPECSMIVNRSGEMIETNMDVIEQQIVLNLCQKNLKFLED